MDSNSERRLRILKITLKAARVNKGYTQNQAAHKMDVDPLTVGKWKSGRSALTVPQFYRLCSLYEIATDDIILPEKSS